MKQDPDDVVCYVMVTSDDENVGERSRNPGYMKQDADDVVCYVMVTSDDESVGDECLPA